MIVGFPWAEVFLRLGTALRPKVQWFLRSLTLGSQVDILRVLKITVLFKL